MPWVAVAHTALLDPSPRLMLADRRAGPQTRPPSQFIELGTYTVAFSFEEQPAGIFRHLSVSSARRDKVPGFEVMAMIAAAFGYTRETVTALETGAPTPDMARVWLEEFEPNHFAVNLLELAEAAPELTRQ